MSRSIHKMTEAARARAYARAMAMPAIGKWKKEVSTGGIPHYLLSFEGRQYRVGKSIYGGYRVDFYEEHIPMGAKGSHLRCLDRQGREVAPTYCATFKTPQAAIAAARRFAAIKGWAS